MCLPSWRVDLESLFYRCMKIKIIVTTFFENIVTELFSKGTFLCKKERKKEKRKKEKKRKKENTVTVISLELLTCHEEYISSYRVDF